MTDPLTGTTEPQSKLDAAKSAVSDGADAVKSGLKTAQNRIASGTETLTEEGRARVIAARRKALQMRRNVGRTMRKGADTSADFYDRQPLVIGALALAIGAAIGGALPRTRTENDYMGDTRDDLFAQAERIFQDEKAKAARVAQSVKDEAADIAQETKADLNSGAPDGKSALDAVGDIAKGAGKRVVDKAKSTAKDENLGKPKT